MHFHSFVIHGLHLALVHNPSQTSLLHQLLLDSVRIFNNSTGSVVSTQVLLFRTVQQYEPSFVEKISSPILIMAMGGLLLVIPLVELSLLEHPAIVIAIETVKDNNHLFI